MTFETGRTTTADPSGVTDRDSFAAFLEDVLGDFESGGEVEWENGTLARFLDAFAAFASARVVDEVGQEAPSWRLFADIVATATGYE